MNPYANEDVAWQRLVDIQREMENSRLWAESTPNLLSGISKLAVRAWILVGLAMRRAPRKRPLRVRRELR
jgi:hypothetical protein